jgi:hypothetical protein
MPSVKPLAWPVVLWLIVTRRVKATIACMVTGIVGTAASFAVVGFSQFHEFLRLNNRVIDVLSFKSYGIVGLCIQLGMSRSIGLAVLVAASSALVVFAAWAGRRDEGLALVACLVLMLVASPLVWTHYFAFLIVPLAIARPRLSSNGCCRSLFGSALWPLRASLRSHLRGWS